MAELSRPERPSESIADQPAADGGTATSSAAPGAPALGRRVSRRALLRGIGLGAVAVGAGAVLEACSSSAAATGAGASGGTSSAPSGAAGAAGKITIGFVTPQTGPLAGFASGDSFVVDRIRQTDTYAKGISVGGKTYAIEIVVQDSQSDPNRASEVARQLILQNKVDLIVTSSTPETTNPVAQVCEAQGVPCVSTVVPWESWFFGRQADPTKPKPFKYTTMFFFGLKEFAGCFVPMWNRVTNDKKVAQMYPNDADGNAFRQNFTPLVSQAGYTPVDGGAYPDGTTDYSAMIGKFKSNGCDIYSNVPLPPDFNTFWKQAAEQGYKPKLATVAKVLLFPADTDALGDLVLNIATDSWWGPYMPYTSSLSGETAKALADAYEAASGKQWLQSLGSTYSLFEVAAVALAGSTDPNNRDAVAAALGKVSYTGISGPIDFTKGPFPGIGIVRPVGVQWKKGTSHPYEMVVVDNSLNPDVPIGGDLVPTNS